MAFNISYIYQAIDKFTPIANRINNSVERTQKKFKRLKDQMDRTNRIMGRFGNTLNSVKSRLIGLGTAMAGAVGVKALVDFDAAMSKVLAVSGSTNKEFKDMRLLAKDLGATTVFSASQAASGMEFLARAGFSASTIIKAMPSVLDLAASSSLDLATAADITSNIMTGFGIEASKTNKIADLMATINASANTNVQQLGDAMKFVGPIAAAMGQSIEQTASALGALSDAGLQGAMAGTGLRRVLSELGSPTKAISKALAAVGVNLRKINPETNDLITILKELAKANLTASDALKIFGDRGGPAFTVLVKNIPKIERLNQKLSNSSGAAKKMATIMRNNLLGAAKETLSAFEGLIITIGDLGLTGALRNLAGALTFISRIFNTFFEKFPKFTKFIATFVSILITAKIATLAWAGAMKLATIATLAFNTALFANPFRLIAVGIIAAISGLIIFKKEIGGLVQSFLGLFDLQMPQWLKHLFGIEGFKINIAADELRDAASIAIAGGTGAINKTIALNQLDDTAGIGIAAREVITRNRLDGNININAPAGVVSSFDARTSGVTMGNLGLNLVGVGP